MLRALLNYLQTTILLPFENMFKNISKQSLETSLFVVCVRHEEYRKFTRKFLMGLDYREVW